MITNCIAYTFQLYNILTYILHTYINVNLTTNYQYQINIKTHGSESRGQEEAGLCDERVSYLHVALL